MGRGANGFKYKTVSGGELPNWMEERRETEVVVHPTHKLNEDFADVPICSVCGASGPALQDHCPAIIRRDDLTQASKFDTGKTPYHLLDTAYLEGTARVLDYGQRKYAAWNWAKGTFEWSRLYSAMMRHMNAFWSGEDNDPETGMSHLWHASCCLMFLNRYHRDGLGTDDRFVFHPPAKPDTVGDPEQALRFAPLTTPYMESLARKGKTDGNPRCDSHPTHDKNDDAA